MRYFNRSLIDRLTIDDISNKTDDELRELMLKCVEDFRLNNPKYMCPVCFEDSYNRNFLVSYCKCKHSCCKNCWKDSVQSQYNDLRGPLHCFECDTKFDRLFDIINEEFLSEDEFNDYSRRVSKIVFKNDIICCPNCKKQYFRSKVNCKCPHCYYILCTNCLNIEHESLNMDCEQFERFMLSNNYITLLQQRERNRIRDLKLKSDKESFSSRLLKELNSEITIRKERQRQQQLIKNEEETKRWLDENTKRCPNCGANINKNGGCNHMTCKNCTHEFCWLCMEKYTPNHFSSTSKCKQFDDGFRGDDYGLEQFMDEV